MSVRTILQSFFVVLALLMPALSSAQGYHCPYEHDCTRCKGIGRSYVLVGGRYCTVCSAFCPLILVPLTSGGAEINPQLARRVQQKVAELQPKLERLLLKVDVSLVRAIAQSNPSAAAQLYILSFFSERGSPPMAMSGDGGSTMVFTADAVEALIRDSTLSEPLDKYMLPLPQGASSSTIKYTVSKRPNGASIDVSHRIVDAQGVELSSPHPDIRVDLQWVEREKSGYWEARSWQPL